MGDYTELLDDLGLTKREGLEYVMRTLRNELEVTESMLRDARLEMLRYAVTGTGRDRVVDLRIKIFELKTEQDTLLKEIAIVKPELEALKE